MAMIKICRDCGHVVQGCTNCNRHCPLCGGAVEKRDYVQYMQLKELKEKDGNNNLPTDEA